MYISNNPPLPLKTFEDLAKNYSLHCVSIYLPMDKTGKEQNEHLAQATLKKCIREIQNSLTEYQLNTSEIKAYLKPIENLIENHELWRNPSDGLAIFLDQKELRYYTLPISFNIKTQVSSNFHVTPLLSLFQDDGEYYLLELSRDYVKLYKASKYNFEDLHIENFAPSTLENTVGFDYKQKMLQFRKDQDAFGAGIYHGHGEGKDDIKKEVFSFLKAIDKGINKYVKSKKYPLVLACVNELFDIYKKANTYPNLYNKNISGDPEFKDKTILHKKSWNLVQPYFEQTKKLKLKQYKELYNTPKISYQINEIVPAALNGKIDTLFVEKHTDLYGLYYDEKKRVQIDLEKKIQNSSLTNLVSINTFLKGGNVFLLDQEEMPEKGRPLNAVFRY